MSASLLHRFRHNPSYVLLMTQLFSSISYGVLLSTLIIYMTQHLGMKSTKANELVGMFIAFNFGLHLLGGFIGGRFLSYRNLYIIGMIVQVIACICFAQNTLTFVYLGLAFYLTGSGLNVPCINMMLIQQFEPKSTQRETAFIWNYAGMNVGFFVGFLIAGIFQITNSLATLFALTAVFNIISVSIISSGWASVKDHTTPLAKIAKSNSIIPRAIIGYVITVLVFFSLTYLLHHAFATNTVIFSIGMAMFLLFIGLAFIQKNALDRSRIFAYIILSAGGLVFFSLYQLAPMGLTLFALHNVNRDISGFIVPPQWIGAINTIVIAIGGLVLPKLFKKIRGYIDLGYPLQFACSLAFIALGFIVLVIGIKFADSSGYVSFSWIASSYVIQSIGELFIGPIGYAMIGLLATESLQGLMMGSWMLMSGGSSGVIASFMSNYAISKTTSTNPLATNPGYSQLFLYISIAAIIASLVIFSLMPFLKRLIGLKAPQTTS